MKTTFKNAFSVSVFGLLCLAGGCAKDGIQIYVEDEYIPTLTLDLASEQPLKYYLSETLDFSVHVGSSYVPISSLTARLVVADSILSQCVVSAQGIALKETLVGELPIPFTPYMPVGEGVIQFIVKNSNGGMREFEYPIAIERPDFNSLTLVHSRGNYTIPRVSQGQYHLQGDIPDDDNAYLVTPPFGRKNKALTFRLNKKTGGIEPDGGDTGIPIGRLSSGKGVFSFNTHTFAYHLPEQAYLYSVWGDEATGTPPPKSPFYDLVISRNKKAVDSRGRTTNRILNSAGEAIKLTLKSGTQVIDGFSGLPRSTVTAQSVQVNLGSKKIINGKPCFFGFSFSTTAGAQSGWIYEENINDPDNMKLYGADFAIDLTPEKIYGDTPTKYKIIAGDPGPWAELKVRSGTSRAENVEVRDYLDRGDGTIYLLYALPYFGGFANDAVIGDGNPTFIPDAGMPRMKLKVFLPSDPLQEDYDAYADPEKQQMEWIFGRIDNIRGWIFALNLNEADK